MMLGALVDAGARLDVIQRGIDSLGITCRLETETVNRRGFRALKLHVRHEAETTHRHLSDIVGMIEASELIPVQQELAKRIFQRLGEAEAIVHGTSIEKVHFHEVGAVDSIADIVGTAIAWVNAGIERLVCAPIPTGHGRIQIAHGTVSVPAPATAELLKGVPLASSGIEAELTTPTGAAIVTTLATEFGPRPPMTISTIATAAGDRDFDSQPNVLRLYVGHTDPQPDQPSVVVLETNIDDSTGEMLGHCVDQLIAAGALDVYTTAIGMKKNRPATKLSVICHSEDREDLERIIFANTTTLGIRRHAADRTVLPRRAHVVATPLGPIAGKLVELPDGTQRFSPEFADCRRLAEAHQLPLPRVMELARRGFSDSL